MNWMMLIKIDAAVDLTDAQLLVTYFGTRIAIRDQTAEPDPAETEEAVYAMGLADKLVGVFSNTPGYQATGTKTHDGHNIVLAAGPTPPQIFKWLFDSVNLRYATSWEIVAAQTLDAAETEQPVLDEAGEPTGETQTVVTGSIWRRVPQSLLPWLASGTDEQGSPIVPTVVTPASIGAISGATSWVVEAV